MSEFNIDNYLSEFAPYFLSLRMVENYNIIDVELPSNWDVGKLVRELTPNSTQVQTLITEQNEQTKLVAIVGSAKTHSFDVLFTRLDKIIKVNQEREEKNKLFKLTVKKLEQLFLDSNLDQLQKLVIDVEDENHEPELGQTDNAKITTSPMITEEAKEEINDKK